MDCSQINAVSYDEHNPCQTVVLLQSERVKRGPVKSSLRYPIQRRRLGGVRRLRITYAISTAATTQPAITPRTGSPARVSNAQGAIAASIATSSSSH